MTAAQATSSQTMTMTAPPAASLEAPLINQTLVFASLSERIRPEIGKLVKDLIASNLFSAEGEQAIKKWEALFYAKFQGLNTDVEKERAYKAIHFLVTKLYKPSHRNDSEAVSLLDPLIEKIVHVLRCFPPTVNLDHQQKADQDPQEVALDPHEKGILTFIEHMKELHYFKKRVAEISLFFQEQMNELTASEKKRREELQEAFDTLKGIIADLNKNRADGMSSISSRLTLLRSKVDQIGQQTIRFGSAMSAMGQKLDHLRLNIDDLTHQMQTKLKLKGDGQ